MIDHLVYATPDLAATVDELARRGLALTPGGAHDGLGTRNALADLGGDAYLEVIGPDLAQPEPARARPFGIDGLRGPQLVAWAAQVPDLDAAVAAARARGHDPGPARNTSRLRGDGVRLHWRHTPFPTAVPEVVPFLIAWGDTEHPGRTAARGARLVSLTALHPDPAAVREQLSALGAASDPSIADAATPALHARLTTPLGALELT